MTTNRDVPFPLPNDCDSCVTHALVSCGRLARGLAGRPLLMLGKRGTGRTTLLSEIGRQARDSGFIVTQISVLRKHRLADILFPAIHEVLQSLAFNEKAKEPARSASALLARLAVKYEVAISNTEIDDVPLPDWYATGDPEMDLPQLFESVGLAAKAAGTVWLLMIDDIDRLNKKDLSALIMALHHINQCELPVMFVGAGLSVAMRLVGDAKPYAERLFKFCEIAGRESGAEHK